MTSEHRLSTGVTGLDEILQGGLIKGRSYLIRGGPGLGKTTLGLHFLAAAAGDEPALFIGFQEPEEQVKENAAVLGLDVSNIAFLSLTPDERFFTEQQGYDVFAAADVEQEPLAVAIQEAVERHAPRRVFIDSMTQLRFLSSDTFQYRKQVLSFLRFLVQRHATVLFSSESGRDQADDDLQFMADGVINIAAHPSGAAIEVSKLRGSGFLRGKHHMRLNSDGMRVFPRMVPPATTVMTAEKRRWSSGSESIDAMLHGGLEGGTISLISGPAGVGKSTLAAQFVTEAASQGGRAAVFLFEEDVTMYRQRARTLSLALDDAIQQGRVSVEQVEPMRYLADEFAALVRRRVEQNKIDMVVLDSIAGFELALVGEGVESRLHAFAKTLSRIGVTVLLLNETQIVAGSDFRATEKAISYMSDNVLFMRYMEIDGHLKKAIGVLKKRLSGFENALRTYEIGDGGLVVRNPIAGLQGVLSGMPMPQDAEK